MIGGLKTRQLDVISHPKGDLYKMLTTQSPEFKGFGEIYFSKIAPFSSKAWRLHKSITSNLTLVSGRVLVVCAKIDSSSFSGREISQFELTAEVPTLITIPPGVWYGFKAGHSGGLLVNLISEPHSEAEVLRQPSDSSYFGFDLENASVGEDPS